MVTENNKSLHYFALALAFSAFLLVIAGALVTSNDAGLSVPDWPLSQGQLMPEMVGGVFYEHGHRMIATTVGLLTIVLNLWLWRTERRLWVRRLGLIAMATVITQGVLGGITVLYFLPVPISVLHASVAALFFCLIITLAVVTSSSWLNLSRSLIQGLGEISKNGNSALKLAVFNTLAVYIQYILGATVRHSGTVEGTKGAVLVTSVLVVHVVGAVFLTGLILFVSRALIRGLDDARIVQLMYLQLGLLFTQLLLGLGAYWVRIDPANLVQPTGQKVFIATSHLAVGALLLATSLIVTLRLAHKVVSREGELMLDSTLAGETL
ncbi:COX15/CtaA family protein [Acidobacteria bacterium AH-259-D05]|nr:COX15/CtaA family protein [Acidobacteria bacterium AH-259-D05]